MNPSAIELPHNVIDLLKDAGDELEVVLDELADDPAVEVSDQNASWYLTIVRDQAHDVLQWVEQIEDQLAHRIDPVGVRRPCANTTASVTRPIPSRKEQESELSDEW